MLKNVWSSNHFEFLSHLLIFHLLVGPMDDVSMVLPLCQHCCRFHWKNQYTYATSLTHSKTFPVPNENLE